MLTTVGPINSGAAAGGAGVATSTGATTHPINGYLVGTYVKYNDSPPAGTTDVTIRTKGTSPAMPSRNLLVLTNAATDVFDMPRQVHQDQTGADVAATYDYIPIDDIIEVVIAQANNGDSVDVWLLVEC